jgi:hypothetical protein
MKEKGVTPISKRPSKKDLAAARLEFLNQKFGKLTPDIVVKDAASPKSVLHGFFTWDDKKAGHKCRLSEARKLIASVEIQYTTRNFTIKSCAYVRDPRSAPRQGYVGTEKLRRDKTWAREAIDLEITQAVSRLERTKDLAKTLGLEPLFTRAIAQLLRISEKVAA